MTLLAAFIAILGIYIYRNKEENPLKNASISLQFPGNLPVMALHNKDGKVMNFLLDSGSNVSHVCSEYFTDLNAVILGTYKDGKVSSLGATNIGITMCKATLYDILENEYNINLSISEQLSDVAKDIEANTGVKIHGLLGTDFLRDNSCIIDFNTLEIYPRE